jgi:ribosome biogenesis GTPase
MDLEKWGWNEHFSDHFEPYALKNFTPGRVISENMNHIRLLTESGEIMAKSSGALYYKSKNKGDLPAVGDWVAAKIKHDPETYGVIHAVLPRKSKFSRKIPGRTTVEQTLAANIDTVFIVMGLDTNFNLRRVERFLTVGWESGAQPVVLLNKEDLAENSKELEEQTLSISGIAPVHTISALNDSNLNILEQYLAPATTTAILGSSGVGKSTLLNRLIGEEIQETRELNVAQKGMHTTRIREMFFLENGAMIIDTPGLRELQLWNVEEGLTDTFQDIEEHSKNCRYNDCRHRQEPGCAVKIAVENGEIPAKRYENYLSMHEELDRLSQKLDKKAQLEQKQKDKRLNKLIKNMKKTHHKY